MLKRLTFALLCWNALRLGEAGEWWHSSEEEQQQRVSREALSRHRKSPFDVPVLKGFLIPGGASGEATGSVDRKVNKGVRTQCAKCSFQFDPKGSVYAMRCEHCVPVPAYIEQNPLVKSEWFKSKQQQQQHPEQSRTTVMSSTPKAVPSSSSSSSRPRTTHKPTAVTSSRPRATHNPDKPPLKSDSTPASQPDAKGPATVSRTVPSSCGKLSKENETNQQDHFLLKDIKSWPDALIELMVKKIELANLRAKHKPLLSALLSLKSIFVVTGSALSKAFMVGQQHVTPVSTTTTTTTTEVIPTSTSVVPRNRKRWHSRNRDRVQSVYPKKSRMNCRKLARKRCRAERRPDAAKRPT